MGGGGRRKLLLRVDKGSASLPEQDVSMDETEETDYRVEKGQPLSASCHIRRRLRMGIRGGGRVDIRYREKLD